ncbi:MAG: DUF4249 domain-containing protein [Cyclobacteriaceae bacterium]
MPRLSIFLLTVFLISSCVDVFEFDLPDTEQNKLIVNGAITSLPGPQEIRVFRSQGFGESDTQPFAVRDAIVYVTDDLGDRRNFTFAFDDLQSSFCVDLVRDLGPTNLDLAQNFRYVSSSGFQGQVGRTYTLHVELSDGTKVVSSPQLLEASIPVGEVTATYVVDETLSESGTEIPDDKWIVEATLDQSGESSEDNYLTWRHRGTFRISTNPELYCDYNDCSAPGVCVPACCDECWVVEYGQSLTNTSAATLESLSENRLTVATIPIIAMRTESIYHLDLFQYRIASDVYDFYEALNGQLTNQGSIFDPPPYSEESNLTYEDGRDEPILGYFWVAGAAHEVLTISPTTVTRQYNYFFPNDCQRVPGASTEKPEYYQN